MKLLTHLRQSPAFVKSFIALAALQGTNFILPLVVVPYLTLTIGTDKFGIVSLVQVLMIYLSTFTDYGFNYTATREIAVAQGNWDSISEVVSRVFFTKFLLLLVSAVGLLGLVLCVPRFYQEAFSCALGFCIVVGHTLMPVWFFQGIEQMKYLTYLNIAAKGTFTILIFIFVHQPADYPLVLLFFGLGNLLAGVVGLWWLLAWYPVRVMLPRAKTVYADLWSGAGLFISNFSIVTYMNINVILLSLWVSDFVLGCYSIAEKIIGALRQLLSVFSQAIYPHVCKLALSNALGLRRFWRKVFLPFNMAILMAGILLYASAEMVIGILTRDTPTVAVSLLRLLSLVPWIVCLNIPAVQWLLARQLQHLLSLITTISAVLSIVLNWLLVSRYGVFGTAWAVIITETSVTLGLWAAYWYVLSIKNLPPEQQLG